MAGQPRWVWKDKAADSRDRFGLRLAYIAPFQYVVVNGSLYFHFTDYGKKMNFFKQKTPVCVEIERYTSNLSEYRFVVLTGKLRLVEDHEERKTAIEKIAEEGKKKLSANFLLAHGFSQGSEWTDFTADKPILIMKLEDVTEKIGLKSPSLTPKNYCKSELTN